MNETIKDMADAIIKLESERDELKKAAEFRKRELDSYAKEIDRLKAGLGIAVKFQEDLIKDRDLWKMRSDDAEKEIVRLKSKAEAIEKSFRRTCAHLDCRKEVCCAICYDDNLKQLQESWAKAEKLAVALKQCSEPTGAYSMDPGQHARNCLTETVRIAKAALVELEEGV